MAWNRNLFLKNIKTLRKSKGWTLADLEARCPSMYAGCLAKMNTAGNEAQPSISIVAELSDALEVSVDSILHVDFSEANEMALFHTNLVDLLTKYTLKHYYYFEELSLEMLASAGELKAWTVTNKDITGEGYYDDSIADALAESTDDTIRLFAPDELRPDGLCYDPNSETQILFKSAYYAEKCKFAGHVYKLNAGPDDYFYLLMLTHGSKTVYEIYCCHNNELSGIDDEDFYRFARETYPIFNSEFDSLEHKIANLYNLIADEVHRPLINDEQREYILNLVKF